MNELNIGSMKDSKKHWSKRVEADGKSKSISVREIENGYIVSVSVSSENKDGEFIFQESEFYSKTNPLEDISVEEKHLSDMKKVFRESSIFD